MARPSSFSQEVADAICSRMAEGESRTQICRDEGMPDRKTVSLWLRSFPDFAKQYEFALTLQREYWADEILDIADDSTNDWVDREVKGGRVVRTLDHEAISRSVLRVDSRKWLLGKLVRHQFGDRVEHSGPDGGAIQHEARVIFVKPDAS